MAEVRVGLERLAAALRSGGGLPELPGAVFERLASGRAGLITNPSAVDAGLVGAPDVLRAAGCRLAALFGPEHGIRGDAPDGQPVAESIDARTGVPCFSLYGETRQPTPGMLAGLDVLVFDLQDVGARFYTFESTMSLAMEAAAGAGIPFVVLDRPNPIGGEEVEGPLLETAHSSFVGLHAIPVRHGCTLGELARLFHQQFGVGEEPHVVRVEGWDRLDTWHDADFPWVLPSPNMPTPDTALVYPGLAFLEGTNVSEGRGTTRPFELFGAPWVDAEALADCLNELGLPGVRFRPARFQPTASKHRGELCHGAQAHVLDRRRFRPVLTGLVVLSVLRESSGDAFVWRRSPDGSYPVDRLAGTAELREAVDGRLPIETVTTRWEEQCQAFARRRKAVELYG